jgi:mono/diheme cytochrome c family protein
MTAVRVSPRSRATLCAACHTSSGTLMVRFGVAGWLGTEQTVGPGAIAPGVTLVLARQGEMPLVVVSAVAAAWRCSQLITSRMTRRE